MYNRDKIDAIRKTVMIMIIISIVIMIFSAAISYGGNNMVITLPNGQAIPVDGLDSNELKMMTTYMTKVAKAQNAQGSFMANSSKVMSEIANNPEKFNDWRKLITGTIKDACNDLNISVNEFIKTPVGIGVAVLVIYKIAGADVLSKLFEIIIFVPLWISVIVILYSLQRKYLSSKVIYNHKKDVSVDGKPKYEYSNPTHTTSYPWDSDEARAWFGIFLLVIGVGSIAVLLAILI